MATQKLGYFLKSGEKVPSVTTIIGKFKDPGALMYWSAGQTAEYIMKHCPETPTRADVLKLCDAGRMAYRNTRDAAAAAGTMAHEAAEAWVRKLPYEFEGSADVVEKAKKSYGAFLEWTNQTRLTVTHTELPLVSELYKFGGTMDGATMNNKRGILDYKTSNSLFAEYLIQIAGYGILWREHFPGDPVTGGYFLARFDRTHGDFGLHWWGELQSAERAFLLMRELYGINQELAKRAK